MFCFLLCVILVYDLFFMFVLYLFVFFVLDVVGCILGCFLVICEDVDWVYGVVLVEVGIILLVWGLIGVGFGLFKLGEDWVDVEFVLWIVIGLMVIVEDFCV